MCGFVGIFGFKSLDESIIKKMGSSLFNRGPDDKGIFINYDSKIAFAHQRLSIQDLSQAGHQPMKSSNGRYIIIFNGEIYNHYKIRKYIESNFSGKTYNWRGSSDTETLIECIGNLGLNKTLDIIEGMFSFALWDNKHKRLVLVKDRMGEKPLYYGLNNGIFFFGSELKAFKFHPSFNPTIDKNSIGLLIKYNFIPSPSSIYKNIYKLNPGSTLTISSIDQELKPERYWNFVQNNTNVFSGSETDCINNLDSLLSKTVAKQMISDVPIGSFLSGGIDSSTITALMQANSLKKINTFTIGFEDFNYNEANFSKKIANYLGTNHNEYYLSSKDALKIIPNLSSIYSEPFADSSQIPTFLVSKMAKEKVKVALAGDGGDELFGGYNRYVMGKQLWEKISYLPSSVRKLISKSISAISPEAYNYFFNNIFKFFPARLNYNNLGDKLHKGARVMIASNTEELYRFFISHWFDINKVVKNIQNPLFGEISFISKNMEKDFIHNMMISDMMYYLPDDILCKVDRAAMANSLETRLPMLDHHIVNFSMQIPIDLKLRNNVGKWILRQVLYKYLPKKFIERPKMGFGIPIGSWLRGPLREWGEDLLNEDSLKKQDYFNFEIIRKYWLEHQSGKKNWATSLWGILMFQEWLANQ